MPSKSKEQAKTMRAIAHGWEPPAGSKVAKIPVSVAKDFASADKAKAKSAEPKKRKHNPINNLGHYAHPKGGR